MIKYIAPLSRVCSASPENPLLFLSANGWDDSIQGTGSDWGGEDVDDSIFGL